MLKTYEHLNKKLNYATNRSKYIYFYKTPNWFWNLLKFVGCILRGIKGKQFIGPQGSTETKNTTLNY